MAHCIVKFHLEILGLVNFVYGALGRFYPRASREVYTVSGDVSNIVAFSTFVDLNDFAETFDSECLLSIEVSAVT